MKISIPAMSILAISTALGAVAHAAQPSGSAPEVSVGRNLPGQLDAQVLAVQIMLDRAQHSPGAIDGRMGGNTRRAVRAYQKANGLNVTGEIDAKLIESLEQQHGGKFFRTYTITEDDVSGPFHSVPDSMTEQAKMDKLTFQSPAEKLAEKFHMTKDFLTALNPNADLSSAGTQIEVIQAGDESVASKVARIEVAKSHNELRAYTAEGKLVSTYPITVGSDIHPSPNTQVEVRAIAMNPTYHFDPEGRSWGPEKKLTIAAGPNNPVGTVWIDLTREGYGIHGTPEPRLIGKTNSHGCVRMTNWDAVELAKAVSKGTTVEFL